MMKCLVCGHIFENAPICVKCGTKTDEFKNTIRENVMQGIDDLINENQEALEELAK